MLVIDRIEMTSPFKYLPYNLASVSVCVYVCVLVPLHAACFFDVPAFISYAYM